MFNSFFLASSRFLLSFQLFFQLLIFSFKNSNIILHLFYVVIQSLWCFHEFFHKSKLVNIILVDGLFAERTFNHFLVGINFKHILNASEADAVLVEADQHGDVVILVVCILADGADQGVRKILFDASLFLVHNYYHRQAI